jgi:DNA topoisomerase-3
MRVFVAEKPSLGRAIAAVLPGPQERHKTHIVSGEGNVVVWCAGHLLAQCMPEDYNPGHEKWALEHLPIVPDEWRLKLAPKARELFNTIRRYVKQATVIVHAGDPDREGQWVVDAVLEQIGTGDTPVKRLLISDLNPPAVRKAIRAMQDNGNFRGLRDAAVGRARADWLYGLNLTRLYTLKGRSAGLSGVLSVGRVQTPVLGLVVRRDRKIAAFVPHPFYIVQAGIVADDSVFKAHWIPGERSESALDPEGRVIDRDHAQAVADAVTGQGGRVTDFLRKPAKQPPPLPFSLPELQKAAARLRGFAPRRTLDLAQSLYEKHKLLTYPRSDCPYLPREHHSQATEVREAIVQTLGRDAPLTAMSDAVNLTLYGACWDDGKVTAHHAIIPTPRGGAGACLSPDERFIYALVAHRYLLQFLPARELEKTAITLVVPTAVGEEVFEAKQERETASGWYAWRHLAGERGEETREDPATPAPLPTLKAGQGIRVRDAIVIEKQTTPPKPFTEATLLDAMTGVARFVEEPLIRKVLRETDGLGTPATQATILETLYKRGYIEKHRKAVVSTDLGKALIDVLPEFVTLPDMTALWELNLNQIVDGDETLAHFMGSIQGNVESLVADGARGLAIPETLKDKSTPPRKATRGRKSASARKTTATMYPCTREGCGGKLRRIKGKHGFFWGCSHYRDGCRETRKDSRGKPAKAARNSGIVQAVTS